MTNELQELLLSYLPKGLHRDACVAGGYAADPEQANDIDLWVLGITPEQFDTVEREIRQHLHNNYLLSSVDPPLRDSQHYDEHPGQFRVVSIQSGPAPMGVQILITKQPTLGQLLKQFDISTHALGYMVVSREVEQAEGWTSIMEPPRVLTYARPTATTLRLDRVVARYGVQPPLGDVLKLHTAVMEEAT